ncbi:hypothetical protein ACFVUH_08450 [Kitasatospora sp. NPDC058032]|uniref:hypothetical protein n=1 Tax=Kitasatospora sp. NPDC058032 TaxID=3346307 RepID=UPI0036DBD716
MPAGKAVRIRPGRVGPVEVSGADEHALRLIAPLGFRPPPRGSGPVHLQTTDGPLARRALATQAADRLARAGYAVDLAPELRISEAGERTLELLADLSRHIDEVVDALGELDDVNDLADAAAQMVTGPYNPLAALQTLFRRAGDSVRRADGRGAGRDELAAWFYEGAQRMAGIVSAAGSVAHTPRPGAGGERRAAATARSAAARTGAGAPILTAPAVPTPAPPTTRRTL